MIKLFVVALLHCAGGDCIPEPLEDYAFKGEEDCKRAVVLLEKANPGKQFQCGTVLRRVDQ